jgi:Uma2 family endonuclease
MATQSAPAAVAGTMSFEEFLTAYEGIRAEWVDGSVLPMSPSSDRHQDIVDFLIALMRYWVEVHRLGIARSSQIVMKIGSVARVPDILFVSSEHRDRLKTNHLEGPADLVVEVVSPESRGRDRGEKYYEYEQAGIREYWLIDPLRERAELYRLDENGAYALVPAGEPPRLRSEVLGGFWIDPRWLWSDPIPMLQSVYEEWGRA